MAFEVMLALRGRSQEIIATFDDPVQAQGVYHMAALMPQVSRAAVYNTGRDEIVSDGMESVIRGRAWWDVFNQDFSVSAAQRTKHTSFGKMLVHAAVYADNDDEMRGMVKLALAMHYHEGDRGADYLVDDAMNLVKMIRS